jgi:hypothetical protein
MYPHLEIMAVSFAEKLKRWRGGRPLKEAAFILGIPYETYRAYELGRRKPHHNCCLCCLEKKMLLSAPVITPRPIPITFRLSA